jgi:hypothetical protein
MMMCGKTSLKISVCVTFLYVLFVWYLFIPTGLLAQGISPQDNLNRAAAEGMGVIQTFDNRYEGVKGSPVIFSEFLSGSVVLTNTTVTGVFLNYDAYNNEVLFKSKIEDNYKVFNNSKILGFSVMDEDRERKFVVQKGIDKPHEILELMVEGNTKYFRVHKKVLLQADFQGAYSSNRKYDEFDHQVSYFYVQGEQRIPFKFNQSAMKKAFPKKADAISKFIKQNKTDFKNDVDCIALLQFIDQ